MSHTANISPEENLALPLESLFFLVIIPILYLHTVTLQCIPVKTGQLPTQKINYTDVCNYEVIFKKPNIPEFTHPITGWLPRDPLRQMQFLKTLRTFSTLICFLSLWCIIFLWVRSIEAIFLPLKVNFTFGNNQMLFKVHWNGHAVEVCKTSFSQ